jgi:hypothetical protein
MLLSAQTLGDTLVSKQKMVELQQKVESLDNSIIQSANTLKSADSLYIIARNYAENANKLVNQYNNTVDLSIAILAILTSVILIAGFWATKKVFQIESIKQINSLVEKSKKVLDEMLTAKDDYFKSLISQHEVEYGFVSKSKILVINKKGTTVNEYLITALNRFSKKVTVEDVDDLASHKFENKFENFNLIIFDNTNTTDCSQNWDFRQMSPDTKTNKTQNNINRKHKERLIEIARNVCEYDSAFFFFGKNDDYFVESLPQFAHLINYANSPSTAFSNIINLLHFRDLYLKSKIM